MNIEYLLPNSQILRLGRLIWKGRLSQGLTPLQLASRIKISREIVLDIEGGHILPVRWVLCALVRRAILLADKKEALRIVNNICPPRKKRFVKKQRQLRKQRCKIRKEVRGK